MMLGEVNQVNRRPKKLSIMIPELTFDDHNNSNKNNNNHSARSKSPMPDLSPTQRGPRNLTFPSSRPPTILENLAPSTAPTKTRRYSSMKNIGTVNTLTRKPSSAKPPGGRVRRKTMAVPGARVRKNTLALPSLKSILSQRSLPGSSVRIPSIAFVVARIKTAAAPEKNYLYDHYEATGNFERDFTFLTNLIGLDIPVTRRRIISTAPLTPRSAYRESGDDNSSFGSRLSARSWPSLARRVLSSEPSSARSCSPTTYVVTNDDDNYFKPRIEIKTEFDERFESDASPTERDDVQVFHNSVTEMYVRGCKLGLCLINVLSKTLPDLDKLTSLNLWNAGLQDESLHCLSQCLQLTSSLKTLCLDGNGQVSSQRFHAFIQPRSQLNLKNFSLRHCNINQVGASNLAEALVENKHLLTLNVSYNQSGNEGAKLLSNAMRINRTLLSLNLSQNGIGDEGAKHFAQMISAFPLTHLETVARREEESKHKREEGDVATPLRRATIGKFSKITMQKKTKTKSGSRSPGRPRSSFEKTKRSMTSSLAGVPEHRNSPRNSPSPILEETKKSTNPLLSEDVRFVDGELWIQGNRCLINLNLSRNKLTEEGLRKLHAAVKHQISEATAAQGPGIIKLSVNGNRFSDSSPIYCELVQMLKQREPKLPYPVKTVSSA